MGFQAATMSQVQVFECFHHFKEGEMPIRSDRFIRCLSASRNDELVAQGYDLIRNLRRLTL
jgi:hypothetical protein